MKITKISGIFLVSLLLMVALPQIYANSQTLNSSYGLKQMEKVKVGIYIGTDTAFIQEHVTSLIDIINSLQWAQVNVISQINSYSDIASSDVFIMIGNYNLSKYSDYLDQFLFEGGRLIIAPPREEGDIKWFNNFTERYGVEFYTDLAIDNESYIGENTTVRLVDSWDKSSPILSRIDMLAMPEVHPLQFINKTIDLELVRYPLIWGMNTTQLNGKNGSDLILAAAMELASSGKMVMLGSYEMFLNSNIKHGDNGFFVLNLISWLSDKADRLEIKDVYVSTDKVIVNSPNPIVEVNFTVVDINGTPVQTDARILVFRRASSLPLIVLNATYLGDGKYSAVIDFKGQRSSIVQLWILVHKKYVGYFVWPNLGEPYEIELIKHLRYTIFPDVLTATLFIIIPLLGFLFVLIRFYPRYRANKKLINDIEKKTEAS
ncbi:MAG: hypothetical protein ACP6IP_00075 [Candidatus Njordarchaeia archaeon]